jgi:hypothetical protein
MMNVSLVASSACCDDDDEGVGNEQTAATLKQLMTYRSRLKS